MRAYIDSDILIWHLRGEKKAGQLMRRLTAEENHELWMGAPQRAEITFFMKPAEEGHTLAVLSQLKTQSTTQSIVDRAAPLYRKWHPSHGIDTNDAILAAMSMETGGRIYTLNLRHFPMPGLDVVKAW